MVAAGLVEAELGAEAAEEAMAAAMGLERKHLERRLLFLGTVGNNAPFVGLLRAKLTVSFPSKVVSSRIGMVTVLLAVSPSAKVTIWAVVV